MIRLFVIAAALFSGFAGAADGTQVTLVFKERALVDVAEVTLADIAEVRVSDAALRRRLATTRIGRVDAIGVERLVKRDRVLAMIAAIDDRVTFIAAGATQTIVGRRAAEFSAARLIDVARAHLETTLRGQHRTLTRIDVEPVGVVDDLRLPVGEVVVRPRAVQGDGLAPRVCVWVDVSVGGRVQRGVPVWLSVKAYAPAVVARHAIAPREGVAPGDFANAEIDIARVYGTPVQDLEALVGMRARVPIASGAVVRVSDVEKNPPVLSNQEVDVRVVVGAVRVRTLAVAEQEGYVGEYIRVRNPTTSAVFSARVTGEKSVQVTQR